MTSKLSFYDWCIKNGEYGQRLLEEIDKTECNPNIHYIRSGSHERINWICKECGYKWSTIAYSRTALKTGCIKCKRRNAEKGRKEKRIKSNGSLYDWCIINDRMDIIEEWDSIKNDAKNGCKDSIKYTERGSSQYVWWKCKICGNEWQTTVKDRTVKNSHCMVCSNKGTSYPEQFIFQSLKQIYPKTFNRGKFKGEEIDIAVEELNLFIEYSAHVWHVGREEKDEYKILLANRYNIKFIQIIEYEGAIPNKEVLNTHTKYIINKNNRKEYLIQILRDIVGAEKLSKIDFNEASNKAEEYSRGIINEEESIYYNAPDLCREWNSELSAKNFKCNSHAIIDWRCTKCSNTWEVAIISRFRKKTGCPFCGYNWYDKQVHINAIKRRKE